MHPREYAEHDGIGLATLVRQGEVSAEELVVAALATVESWEPRLGALTHLLAEPALAAARGAPSAGDAAGPFVGVPFLLKELGLHAAGVPVTLGSRLGVGLAAPVDSELMARYRRAGLVLLGTTKTPELGLSFTTEPLLSGPTRSPWHAEYGAGGSSGGSAAAVAAGIVPLAHGSDAAGSLRIPAAACGLVALKPARGRTPSGPLQGEQVFGLAVEHVLTRSVRDSAAALDATGGPERGAPYAAPAFAGSYLEAVTREPRRLRIGYVEGDAAWDEDCRTACARAAALAASLGHEVAVATWPASFDAVVAAVLPLLSAFAAASVEGLARLLGRPATPDTLEPCTLTLAAHGRRLSALDLVQALALRDALTRAAADLGGYDLLLTPTQTQPPPRIGTTRATTEGLDAPALIAHLLTPYPHPVLANLTGQPALSLPLGRSRSGLPLGVHFLARAGEEATLFALAGQLERAAPWGAAAIDPR